MPDFDALRAKLTGWPTPPDVAQVEAKAAEAVQADVHVPAGVVVPPSPLEQQIKGQVRVFVAALAGALVTAAANRLHMPILTSLWGVQGEQVVGAITGLVMLALMSGWSWVRARLTHTKLASIAADPRVPDEVAKLAAPSA